MNKYRSHNCSELTEKDVGKTISISGWLHRKRDHGNLLFIDLRDHYGLTQCVIENNNKYIFPILAVIPLQKLAFMSALNLGLDPDRPQNLAKTVTVE